MNFIFQKLKSKIDQTSYSVSLALSIISLRKSGSILPRFVILPVSTSILSSTVSP
nr:MAG TPA: hypothetical protein [Caudoviricetes sp.]